MPASIRLSRRLALALLSGLLLVTVGAGGALAQSMPPVTGDGATSAVPDPTVTGAAAQGDAANPLADTSWVMGELTADGTTTPIPSGIRISLVFSDEAAGGSAGCNGYMGSYTTDGVATLSFGTLGSTMMACEEPLMALEAAYLKALGTVAGFTAAEGSLVLSDASGAAVLSYAAAAPASFEGPWIVNGYNNGKEAVVSVVGDTTLTVSFHPDGTVEGYGGCNTFSGGYSIDGDAIAIGPLMQTMMSCGEELDTQEHQYTTALQAATTWAIQEGTLELRDATGAMQVPAVSAIG